MKFLYIGSSGSEDPTRAGLTFVMAQGAKEAGHDVEVALQGDAVVLFNEGGCGERPARRAAEYEGIACLHQDEPDPGVWVRALLPRPWGCGRAGKGLVQ